MILSLALADGEVVGETLAIGHVQDISTRKQAEDELRHSRERLAEAERVAQMGSWEWDITNDRTVWSDGMFHVYGLNPDEVDPTLRGPEHASTPTTESSSVERSNRPSPNDHRSRSNTAPSAPTAESTRCAAAGRSSSTTPASRSGSLASRRTSPTPSSPKKRFRAHRPIWSVAPPSYSSWRYAPRPSHSPTPHAPLTPRQLEILRLIAQGLTNAAIAERLVVTESTVKWHVKQILAKTASTNRAEAVARVLGTPQ